MKRLISLVSALALIAAFTMGCSGYVSKETKVKCPKCGAVFTVDEGIQNIGKVGSPG